MRLFKIEWQKIWPYKTFRFMMGIYFFCTLLFFLSPEILSIGQFKLLSSELLSFPVVWQNIAFVAQYFNIMAALMVINLIANEFNYRTLRQNVIDGMSRLEFILSKAIMVLLVSSGLALFIVVIGIIVGTINSQGISGIFENTDFVFGFFIQSLGLMSFAMLLTFLFKRTGITTLFFLLYISALEPILRSNLTGEAVKFFPSKSIFGIIKLPHHELLQAAGGLAQNSAFVPQLFSTACYTLLFVFLSYLLIHRRDL